MTDEFGDVAGIDLDRTVNARTSPYIDVLEPGTGKLLFRIDPQRQLIEIQHRRVRTLIDLTEFGLRFVGAPIDAGFS